MKKIQCGGVCLSSKVEWDVKQEDCGPDWAGQKVRPYLQNKRKRAGGVAQVLEHLPIKYKTLSSNSGIVKNQK
jgi:hypothetical protein